MAEDLYKTEDLPAGATVRDEVVRGHQERGELYFVAPGRRVIDVPGHTWPAARPEECQNDGNVKAKWIEEKVLVCQGCGLDCT
jgi:hypothetical protein